MRLAYPCPAHGTFIDPNLAAVVQQLAPPALWKASAAVGGLLDDFEARTPTSTGPETERAAVAFATLASIVPAWLDDPRHPLTCPAVLHRSALIAHLMVRKPSTLTELAGMLATTSALRELPLLGVALRHVKLPDQPVPVMTGLIWATHAPCMRSNTTSIAVDERLDPRRRNLGLLVRHADSLRTLSAPLSDPDIRPVLQGLFQDWEGTVADLAEAATLTVRVGK